MRILLSGATGLVGTSLTELLLQAGHAVTRLARENSSSRTSSNAASNSLPQLIWNPKAKTIDSKGLENFDAIVHLGGENIAKKRWGAAMKKEIRDSRVLSTQFLAESLAKLEFPPKVFVCASALGYYGETGEAPMSEEGRLGDDFLAKVCNEWEAACQPARDAGIRTVNTRIGVVLSTHGGALEKMLPPFRWGLGGIVGSGKQYWSWVSIEDVRQGIKEVIENETYTGAVNLVSPNAVTCKEFVKTLGKVLSRPTLFPLPAFVVRLLMGEMGETLLLMSTRVVPQKLLDGGFQFQHAQLKNALTTLIAAPQASK